MARKLMTVKFDGVVEPTYRSQWNAAVKYDSRKYFPEREESPFLNHTLPCDYIELTAKGVGSEASQNCAEWIKLYLDRGLILPPRFGDNRVWVFLLGLVTDEGIRMFMVPEECNVNLEMLGIHVRDAQKFTKYLKRMIAPHKGEVFGKILKVDPRPDGAVVTFQLEDGYVGRGRHIKLETLDARRVAIADGQIRLGYGFVKHIGDVTGIRAPFNQQSKKPDWAVYSAKVSGWDSIGVIKGYGHVQPGLNYDYVMYGTKEAVTYDNFFFGIMGDLTPGTRARLDLQSVINFNLEGFLTDAFQQAKDKIFNALDNPDKLRAQALHVVEDDVQLLAYEALAAGIDPQVEPGLFRRISKLLLAEINDIQKGRIPWDDAAIRVSIVPDPHMFDDEGDIHPEKTVIKKGHIVCWDAPEGKTAEYRQPNGHPMEHSRSINKHDYRFEAYKGYQRCFYGADLLEQNAPKNGADNDDDQMLVYKPEVVNHFWNLSYPVMPKVKASKISRLRPMLATQSMFAKKPELGQVQAYGKDDFKMAIDMGLQQNIRLGQIVNMIMLDAATSGENKKSMLENLKTRHAAAESGTEYRKILARKYNWLLRKQDNFLRDLASNLDGLIDYCVMGKGDPAVFQPMFEKLMLFMRGNKQHENPDLHYGVQVYPYFFAEPGTGFMDRGRVPATKVLNQDYVLATCMLDNEINYMKEERSLFANSLRNEEYFCITPVPQRLLEDYSLGESMIKWVEEEVIGWWKRERSEYASLSGKEAAKRYNQTLYGEMHLCNRNCPSPCPLAGTMVKEGLAQILGSLDEDLQISVAVSLKQYTQRNRSPFVDPMTGMVQSVPDGLFFNDVVFRIYMRGLRKADLLGSYVKIDLDPQNLSYRDGVYWVTIEAGIVFDMNRKDTERIIGTVAREEWSQYEDGEYRMAYGYIEFRSPAKELTKAYVSGEAETGPAELGIVWDPTMMDPTELE